MPKTFIVDKVSIYKAIDGLLSRKIIFPFLKKGVPKIFIVEKISAYTAVDGLLSRKIIFSFLKKAVPKAFIVDKVSAHGTLFIYLQLLQDQQKILLLILHFSETDNKNNRFSKRNYSADHRPSKNITKKSNIFHPHHPCLHQKTRDFLCIFHKISIFFSTV